MIPPSSVFQPVPDDAVIDYIRRGISIPPERRVEIEWEAVSQDRFFVRVVVGAMTDAARCRTSQSLFTDTGANIDSAQIKSLWRYDCLVGGGR